MERKTCTQDYPLQVLANVDSSLLHSLPLSLLDRAENSRADDPLHNACATFETSHRNICACPSLISLVSNQSLSTKQLSSQDCSEKKVKPIKSSDEDYFLDVIRKVQDACIQSSTFKELNFSSGYPYGNHAAKVKEESESGGETSKEPPKEKIVGKPYLSAEETASPPHGTTASRDLSSKNLPDCQEDADRFILEAMSDLFGCGSSILFSVGQEEHSSQSKKIACTKIIASALPKPTNTDEVKMRVTSWENHGKALIRLIQALQKLFAQTSESMYNSNELGYPMLSIKNSSILYMIFSSLPKNASSSSFSPLDGLALESNALDEFQRCMTGLKTLENTMTQDVFHDNVEPIHSCLLHFLRVAAISTLWRSIASSQKCVDEICIERLTNLSFFAMVTSRKVTEFVLYALQRTIQTLRSVLNRYADEETIFSASGQQTHFSNLDFSSSDTFLCITYCFDVLLVIVDNLQYVLQALFLWLQSEKANGLITATDCAYVKPRFFLAEWCTGSSAVVFIRSLLTILEFPSVASMATTSNASFHLHPLTAETINLIFQMLSMQTTCNACRKTSEINELTKAHQQERVVLPESLLVFFEALVERLPFLLSSDLIARDPSRKYSVSYFFSTKNSRLTDSIRIRFTKYIHVCEHINGRYLSTFTVVLQKATTLLMASLAQSVEPDIQIEKLLEISKKFLFSAMHLLLTNVLGSSPSGEEQGPKGKRNEKAKIVFDKEKQRATLGARQLLAELFYCTFSRCFPLAAFLLRVASRDVIFDVYLSGLWWDSERGVHHFSDACPQEIKDQVRIVAVDSLRDFLLLTQSSVNLSHSIRTGELQVSHTENAFSSEKFPLFHFDNDGQIEGDESNIKVCSEHASNHGQTESTGSLIAIARSTVLHHFLSELGCETLSSAFDGGSAYSITKKLGGANSAENARKTTLLKLVPQSKFCPGVFCKMDSLICWISLWTYQESKTTLCEKNHRRNKTYGSQSTAKHHTRMPGKPSYTRESKIFTTLYNLLQNAQQTSENSIRSDEENLFSPEEVLRGLKIPDFKTKVASNSLHNQRQDTRSLSFLELMQAYSVSFRVEGCFWGSACRSSELSALTGEISFCIHDRRKTIRHLLTIFQQDGCNVEIKKSILYLFSSVVTQGVITCDATASQNRDSLFLYQASWRLSQTLLSDESVDTRSSALNVMDSIYHHMLLHGTCTPADSQPCVTVLKDSSNSKSFGALFQVMLTSFIEYLVGGALKDPSISLRELGMKILLRILDDTDGIVSTLGALQPNNEVVVYGITLFSISTEIPYNISAALLQAKITYRIIMGVRWFYAGNLAEKERVANLILEFWSATTKHMNNMSSSRESNSGHGYRTSESEAQNEMFKKFFSPWALTQMLYILAIETSASLMIQPEGLMRCCNTEGYCSNHKTKTFVFSALRHSVSPKSVNRWISSRSSNSNDNVYLVTNSKDKCVRRIITYRFLVDQLLFFLSAVETTCFQETSHGILMKHSQGVKDFNQSMLEANLVKSLHQVHYGLNGLLRTDLGIRNGKGFFYSVSLAIREMLQTFPEFMDWSVVFHLGQILKVYVDQFLVSKEAVFEVMKLEFNTSEAVTVVINLLKTLTYAACNLYTRHLLYHKSGAVVHKKRRVEKEGLICQTVIKYFLMCKEDILKGLMSCVNRYNGDSANALLACIVSYLSAVISLVGTVRSNSCSASGTSEEYSLVMPDSSVAIQALLTPIYVLFNFSYFKVYRTQQALGKGNSESIAIPIYYALRHIVVLAEFSVTFPFENIEIDELSSLRTQPIPNLLAKACMQDRKGCDNSFQMVGKVFDAIKSVFEGTLGLLSSTEYKPERQKESEKLNGALCIIFECLCKIVSRFPVFFLKQAEKILLKALRAELLEGPVDGQSCAEPCDRCMLRKIVQNNASSAPQHLQTAALRCILNTLCLEENLVERKCRADQIRIETSGFLGTMHHCSDFDMTDQSGVVPMRITEVFLAIIRKLALLAPSFSSRELCAEILSCMMRQDILSPNHFTISLVSMYTSPSAMAVWLKGSIEHESSCRRISSDDNSPVVTATISNLSEILRNMYIHTITESVEKGLNPFADDVPMFSNPLRNIYIHLAKSPKVQRTILSTVIDAMVELKGSMPWKEDFTQSNRRYFLGCSFEFVHWTGPVDTDMQRMETFHLSLYARFSFFIAQSLYSLVTSNKKTDEGISYTISRCDNYFWMCNISAIEKSIQQALRLTEPNISRPVTLELMCEVITLCVIKALKTSLAMHRYKDEKRRTALRNFHKVMTSISINKPASIDNMFIVIMKKVLELADRYERLHQSAETSLVYFTSLQKFLIELLELSRSFDERHSSSEKHTVKKRSFPKKAIKIPYADISSSDDASSMESLTE